MQNELGRVGIILGDACFWNAVRTPATTATIIIRFCTLWFGVTLGAIALAIFSRRYGEERAAGEPVAGEPSVTQ